MVVVLGKKKMSPEDVAAPDYKTSELDVSLGRDRWWIAQSAWVGVWSVCGGEFHILASL